MARGSNWGSGTLISKGSAVVTTTPCSLYCWYNPANFASDSILVSVVATSGNSDIFDLQVVASTKFAIAETGQSGQSPVWKSANDTVVQTIGIWSSLLAVYASPTSRILYRDGASAATESTSRTPASLVKMGIGNANATNPGHGSIAFVAIWSTNLSASDASSLWQGAHPRKIKPGNLLACVNMSELTTPATEPDYVSSTGWPVTGGLNAAANPRIYF